VGKKNWKIAYRLTHSGKYGSRLFISDEFGYRNVNFVKITKDGEKLIIEPVKENG
jgi:hypothetical protein